MMISMQNTYSPIDGSLYVERPYADDEQISAALDKAKTAQVLWKKLHLSERKIICTRAVEAFVANKDQIAEELCWQMGRPIRYAAGEIDSFSERSKYMILAADEALEPVQIREKDGFTRYINREPIGVVLVIAPWNFPVHTPINAIIPALLAGNAVILKHSSQTPLCAERIFEAFRSAGIPDGVFQYLHMSHQDTEIIIQAPEINAVAFTGSVSAGVKVETAAAGRFISVGLELGG